MPNEQLAFARRQILTESFSCPAGPWTVGPDEFDVAVLDRAFCLQR